MKCPFCGQEMERGFIQSPQELAWGPQRRLFGSTFYDDLTMLSELSMLKGSAVISYNCKNCKKIVIDYCDGMPDANKKCNKARR